MVKVITPPSFDNATVVVARRADRDRPNPPPRDLLSTLPVRVPRDEAARLVTRYYFKVSRRSMERWPVRWWRLNGYAHVETAELFAEAEARVAATTPVMGGNGSTSQHAAT
jgi:hypothetical protein